MTCLASFEQGYVSVLFVYDFLHQLTLASEGLVLILQSLPHAHVLTDIETAHLTLG